MCRRITIFAMLIVLGTLSARAQHYDRGYDSVQATEFVEKGNWMVGGSAKYSQHINKNYSFVVFNDINSKGYTIAASPKVLYMFRDNMGIGAKFSYSRGMLDLSSANLTLSEISMSARDVYEINHEYTAYAVCRAYIPLAGSKRIAMYADIMLGGSFGQGKAYNAGGSSVVGTYRQNYCASLAVDPGLTAFLTDRLALELNIGIFGVSYRWSDQIHNQTQTGSFDSTRAGFTLNLLSAGVGLSIYI